VTGEQIERAEGRWLFGQNPGRYQAARPDYPDRMYEILVDPCGLADGCGVLEVGAGTGQVTEHLAEHGARPIVAIEPDSNFCEVLEELAKRVGGAVVPIGTTFEAAELERGTFDLAVSATAFHWLDRESGPRDLGACLRPGGWLALFWNTFGDPRAPDPFHYATDSILSNLASSPSHPIERPLPFALDREGRLNGMLQAD